MLAGKKWSISSFLRGEEIKKVCKMGVKEECRKREVIEGVKSNEWGEALVKLSKGSKGHYKTRKVGAPGKGCHGSCQILIVSGGSDVS